MAFPGGKEAQIRGQYPIKMRLDPDKVWKAVPYVNGMPLFSASTDTYWTTVRSWEGDITIDGEIYHLRCIKSNWFVKDKDKRTLPDNVSYVCTKIWSNFLEAYLEEKFIRKGRNRKKDSIDNKEYYESNKQQIMDNRQKNQQEFAVTHHLKINEIYKMIIDGKTKQDIVLYFQNQEGITERRVNQLIAGANRMMIDLVKEDRLQLKEKHHALLLELYKKNIEREDYKEARSVLESLNKMYALNEPVTNKLEIKQQIIKFSFDVPVDDEQIRNNRKLKKMEAQDVEYKDIDDEITPPSKNYLMDDELPWIPDEYKKDNEEE